MPVLASSSHHDLVFRQDHHAAGRLVHQGVGVVFEAAHHDAADHVARVGRCRPAGRRHALGEGDADRHSQSHRLGHGARDREVFLEDRLRGRPGDVEGRFDVDHHRPHVQRNTPGRDDAAEHVVDQDELVAGWIRVAERGDLDAAWQPGSQGVDDVVVLLLDADPALGLCPRRMASCRPSRTSSP